MDPIPPTDRGMALAMAADMAEAITGRGRRLYWCVDLERDVGVTRVRQDPTDPGDLRTLPSEEGEARWCALLQRCKAALDRTEGGCPFGMVVRYVTALHGRKIECTFDFPHRVSLSALAGRTPPAGVWRVVPDYTREGKLHNEPTEEGMVPASFWYDGIPF